MCLSQLWYPTLSSQCSKPYKKYFLKAHDGHNVHQPTLQRQVSRGIPIVPDWLENQVYKHICLLAHSCCCLPLDTFSRLARITRFTRIIKFVRIIRLTRTTKITRIANRGWYVLLPTGRLWGALQRGSRQDDRQEFLISQPWTPESWNPSPAAAEEARAHRERQAQLVCLRQGQAIIRHGFGKLN